LILYFLYRSYTSNLAKDIELKEITNTLDKFVIFSKSNIDGIITYSSEALEKVSGYSHEELIGHPHSIFRHPDMSSSIYKELWDTILSKKMWSGNLLNRAKDGSSYWVNISILPEIKDSKIIGFSAFRVDISNQKELECEKEKTLKKTKELQLLNKKLEELSVIDALTQIYNRLKLDSVIQENYERYKRYHKTFSILLIDIDLFKHVNDTYGHLIGDDVLKQIANIIKYNTRKVDTLGRWGGEEFMVICEETDEDGAYRLAENIRQSVDKYRFDVIHKKTISIGISEVGEDLSIQECIKRADDALYYAKTNGRNRSTKFSDIDN